MPSSQVNKHCRTSKALVENEDFLRRIDRAKGGDQRLVIKSPASAREGLSCNVTQPLLAKRNDSAKPCLGWADRLRKAQMSVSEAKDAGEEKGQDQEQSRE